jgi:hypothetical protein
VEKIQIRWKGGHSGGLLSFLLAGLLADNFLEANLRWWSRFFSAEGRSSLHMWQALRDMLLPDVEWEFESDSHLPALLRRGKFVTEVLKRASVKFG